MSSKNDILSAIRRHTGKRYDMPELTLDAITYEDKILQFTDSLKAVPPLIRTISTILVSWTIQTLPSWKAILV